MMKQIAALALAGFCIAADAPKTNAPVFPYGAVYFRKSNLPSGIGRAITRPPPAWG
ncbi:MAG: hypothetical protein ACR2I2_18745 [Bryobacteraceae bacterium]